MEVGIRHQRVAHSEEFVYTSLGVGDKSSLVGRFPVVLCLCDTHGRRTRFDPYEFPVVVEVVVERLAMLKGRIGGGALCAGRLSDC